MENKPEVCCLRCGEPLEDPPMGRAREICLGCKYDLITINNERVLEFNNDNGFNPEATGNSGRTL